MKDKFIAFVDILGFSSLVEAEEQKGNDLSRLLELTETLGSPVRTGAPIACPNSRRASPDVDFKTTQISDCVVVSTEISPAGIVSLVQHCFVITLALLSKSSLCRGYITRGNIVHNDHQFIGTGYMHALKSQKTVAFMRTNIEETGTPFVQIDNRVTEYVKNESDDCVRKVFDRMVRSDGSYTAIYPFEALSKIPSALVTPDFNPDVQKLHVQRSIGFRHLIEALAIS